MLDAKPIFQPFYHSTLTGAVIFYLNLYKAICIDRRIVDLTFYFHSLIITFCLTNIIISVIITSIIMLIEVKKWLKHQMYVRKILQR